MPIGVPGPWELLIILLIVVVIFGAGRLSEIGGALGKGIREFRSSTKDEEAAAAEEKAKAEAAGTPTSPSANGTAPVAGTAPAAQRGGTGTASAVAAPVATENKCASCGTVNPREQVFCGQCGQRLSVAA